MKKESMLVVEDEGILREALVDYLSSEGHKVDSADDGEKGLEKFKSVNYDVMIIDLKLPGRDGISILKEVKAKNPETKVIIITAYPTIETAVEAMRAGAIDYLPKPFEIDQLQTSLRQSYEVEVLPSPPFEAPEVEEEVVAPPIPKKKKVQEDAKYFPKNYFERGCYVLQCGECEFRRECYTAYGIDKKRAQKEGLSSFEEYRKWKGNPPTSCSYRL